MFQFLVCMMDETDGLMLYISVGVLLGLLMTSLFSVKHNVRSLVILRHQCDLSVMD